MKFEIIRCEICEAQHDTRQPLPDSWFTLKQGASQTELHFHDTFCLARWLCMAGVSFEPPPLHSDFKPVEEQQEQPACKARRFLLVDEHANITEGVLWADGSVCLDPMSRNDAWFYVSWGGLKEANQGSGVQWIDQEVAE